MERQSDYIDNLCESEEESKAAVNQVPHFIAPAMELLDELHSAEPDDDEEISELEEQIEDAVALIAEAEWTVENTENALVRWKLEM